ncbi:MAG TPA: molybdenum cofactor guanylyltransferase [Candidatus Binataceae bacterium]|nr:molybdenum cofactor guanylyltransferase [Candidatus Binataceae bacterium]
MAAELAAVVLAGGRGSRLGAPKAGLRLGNDSLLSKTVGELKRNFAKIIVVAAAAQLEQPWLKGLAGVSVVFDPSPYPGPLSALGQGLRAAQASVVFACGCDLPFLRVELAAGLCALLEPSDQAVAAQVQGRPQPLCAAYRRSDALTAIDALLAAKETRLRALLERLATRWLRESELRALDPELASFFNLNTAEDYLRAQAVLNRSRPA